MKAAEIALQRVALRDLHEFPNNPNEQDNLTFNNLINDIQEDGYDEAMAVVPRNVFDEELDGYYVVSGNHRLRALGKLGYTSADVAVKSWDAEESKVKVMRRNMIRGQPNPQKFTKLVDSIKTPYTEDQLADAMGFTDIDKFAELYNKETENRKSKRDDVSTDPAQLFDGMTTIINKLFEEYGDTVPYNFMFFLLGGKIHCTVQANKKLKKLLTKVSKKCVKDNKSINDVLTGLLAIGMEEAKFGRRNYDEARVFAASGEDGPEEQWEVTFGKPEEDLDFAQGEIGRNE